MKTSHAVAAMILAFALAGTLSADVRRRATSPPRDASLVDALGIGPMAGPAVSGTVASVQGTVITLNSGAAAPIRIEAANAKIVGEKEGFRTLADVTPGSRVTAFINIGTTVAAGAPLPAQLIALESQPDLVVTGPIESIDVPGLKLTVLGISIAIDANTSFGTAFPTFAPVKGLADLAVGQIVNVNAAFAASTILAKRVFVTSPGTPASAMLRGTVKSISATSWVITDKDSKDVTVLVDAQTKINGNPKVGDEVQVVAKLDPASNYVALVIVKLQPDDAKELEIRGYVKSIAPDQWSIGGPLGSMMPDLLIKIAATTVIYPDPHVGDVVVVTGVRDASGIFVARSIRKEDTPPAGIELHGVVSSIAPDKWMLTGPWMSAVLVEVKITPATVIYANPKVGDKVVVSGTRDANGVITAKKIARDE